MTRAGTLSRVMISCAGISSVTVRRLTRTMRSIAGIRKISPGPALAGHAAEAEDDAALVLAQDAHRVPAIHERGHGEEDEDEPEHEDHAISSHSSARRTDSVRPLTRSTTTGRPRAAPPR